MHSRFKPGSFTGDAFAHAAPLDCKGLASKLGQGACEQVLMALCEAGQAGERVTIWDLPRRTALPLHEAFAAIRALEFGRFVRINDNPSDPLGATAEILAEGVERLSGQVRS